MDTTKDIPQKKYRFATTVDYRDDPRYLAHARRILSSSQNPGWLDELHMFCRILSLAFQEPVLLLRSSWGRTNPDVLAAAVISIWPKRFRPLIILKGCMWEPKTGFSGLLQKLIIKMADRAIVCYSVQSSEELIIFSENWGIDPNKLRLCLYFFTFTQEDIILPPEESTRNRGTFIFAGGNSHRDYEALLKAADCLPEYQFFLATNRLKDRTVPSNVTAKPVPHQEFVRLMQEATAVVVPLQPGMHRAVGQQTYLNAMWLGKPTIISQALGVHDHVRHGKHALIVDNEPESIKDAIHWIFNPDNQQAVDNMRQEATNVVNSKFRFEDHVTCLLKAIEETIFTYKPELLE